MLRVHDACGRIVWSFTARRVSGGGVLPDVFFFAEKSALHWFPFFRANGAVPSVPCPPNIPPKRKRQKREGTPDAPGSGAGARAARFVRRRSEPLQRCRVRTHG